MSRLRTLLVFAALACLATVLAACGSSGGGSSDENPQTVLQDATFKGIEDADLDLKIGVKVSGDEGGNVDASLSGPFQSRGGKELPELEMTAEASGSVGGKDIDFDGGLVLLPGKAYVNYEGTDYEVDPTTFSFIEGAIKQADKTESETPTEAATACQEAATAELKPADFVDDLKNEGGADVGGTETTKVSGELNVSSAYDSLVKLLEDPACSSQLEAAGPLPLSELEDSRGEIESALQGARADVYVGDDDIVRRVTTEFTIQPKASDEKVEIDLDISLSGVNEGQEISAPDNAEPLEGLFKKLGVNPLELLQATQGGDIGGLLEGLTGGGEVEVPGVGNLGSASEVRKCLEEATSPVDIQKCTAKSK